MLRLYNNFIKPFHGWSITTRSYQVFREWNTKEGYNKRSEWSNDNWFDKNRESLILLLTKYDLWRQDWIFINNLLHDLDWYSGEILTQNNIRVGKVKWAWALNFKEEKTALNELKKVIKYIDDNLKLDSKYLKIGIEGKRGVKLEAQGHFFFVDLRKFLKGWEQRRIDRVEVNKKNENREKSFALAESNYPKNRYRRAYSKYLFELNELLNEFDVLPLPMNPKTKILQKTSSRRLVFMVELLELMGVDFMVGSKDLEPSQQDKESRVKTILSRIYN